MYNLESIIEHSDWVILNWWWIIHGSWFLVLFILNVVFHPKGLFGCNLMDLITCMAYSLSHTWMFVSSLLIWTMTYSLSFHQFVVSTHPSLSLQHIHTSQFTDKKKTHRALLQPLVGSTALSLKISSANEVFF